MLNPNLKTIKLNNSEYKLYSRQLVLNSVGIEGQKRLKSAKILFIGAGALASSALIYLAASGVGCIGIIDKDKVVESNLHRQIIYNYHCLNQPKVNSAKDIIKNINNLCDVIAYNEELSSFNYLDIIKKYDLIIDSCDNFETRYLIDIACYKLHKVHIYGAIREFEGQISVFNYKNGPRYQDIYPPYLNLQNTSCNSLGALGIVPGVIGMLQATEAMKIIIGIGEILSGQLLIYSSLNTSFKKINIPYVNSVRLKYNNIKNNKISKINSLITKTTTLNSLQCKQKDKFLIIDLRQPNEFHLNHISKSINIPIINLKSKNTLSFIKQNSIDKNIIIYCSRYARSILGSKILSLYKINNSILLGELNE
uniref:Molybdopterin biosynthesis protein n=1 Tax=Gelidium gabrielsonii TaxID=2483892 RepID=A0A3G2QXP2_9FLOR|nr:molybdopterin biosynthesis protein [Gelidium gabrielsonii]AYO27766.1 molybdopterin biosynthesis protein [Gelidium gabrielsonii]